MSLYKQIDVWKSDSENRIAIYCCLENLDSGKFFVDRVEFFNVPIDRREYIDAKLNQIEIFVEEMPENRLSGHESLGAAIRFHDDEFEN